MEMGWYTNAITSKINKETQKKIYNFGQRRRICLRKISGLIEATNKCINEDVVLDGELLVWDFNKINLKLFVNPKNFE